MLSSCKIIVLHTIKHSDNGVVVNAYSDSHGRCAYYYFAGKRVSRSNLLAPLSILNITARQRHANTGSSGAGLPIICEASEAYGATSLKTDVRKSAIAIYMCELLTKCVREVENNPQLFNFITHSVMVLDNMESGVENFHLHFTASLCKALGYMPTDNYSAAEPYFNFVNARFVGDYLSNFCYSPIESQLLHNILSTPLERLHTIECSGRERNLFIQKLIEYISYHSSYKMELKSLPVLRELFA